MQKRPPPPRPPGTPDDVEIAWQAPAALLPKDAALGVKLAGGRVGAGTPRHRLVTVGDSLTQGFKSFAIADTDHSWPAIVAHELGWLDQFRRPTYAGPANCPGLPLNLEAFLPLLEAAADEKPLLFDLPSVLLAAQRVMDDVEDYWERGPGSEPPAPGPVNHNLGIYGWDLRDAMSKTVGWCLDRVQRGYGHKEDDLVRQLPDAHQERSALRVLWGDGDRATTQISAATALGSDGSLETGGQPGDSSDGIETLVIALGANNALGSVVDLKVVWSAAGYRDLDAKSAYTVWRPTHFEAELDELVKLVTPIRARHVIWTSVPHVTIVPIARGVGLKPFYSRYFTRYARVWTSDEEFDGNVDQCLTGDEARAVDSAIDAYNQAIQAVVKTARSAGRDWFYFDGAGLLDRMAFRRYLEDPRSQPPGFKPYEQPPELSSLTPIPDTRMLTSDRHGRLTGGLIGLDGVHPTTLGYGIVAQEVIRVMEVAGVRFLDGEGKPRRRPVQVDWQRLFEADPLLLNLPRTLDEDMKVIGRLNQLVDLLSALR